MGKRKTVANDAIDALFAEEKSPPKKAPTKRKIPEPTVAKKERFTVHLPSELIDRLRNAVFWTPGLTLASLAEEVLTDAIEGIERERGEPFPHRKEELKGGRPLKRE
jgi:hypothetical protein